MNVRAPSSRRLVQTAALVAVTVAGCSTPAGRFNPLTSGQENQQLRAALYRYREELAGTKTRLATVEEENRQLQRLLAEEQGRTVALRQQLERLGTAVPDYYRRSAAGRPPTATAAVNPQVAGTATARLPAGGYSQAGSHPASTAQPTAQQSPNPATGPAQQSRQPGPPPAPQQQPSAAAPPVPAARASTPSQPPPALAANQAGNLVGGRCGMPGLAAQWQYQPQAGAQVAVVQAGYTAPVDLAATPQPDLPPELAARGRLAGVSVGAQGQVVRISIATATLFEPGSVLTRPQARLVLDRIGLLLHRYYPQHVVSIEGCNAEPTDNRFLARKRAIAMRDFLWARAGISAQRMHVTCNGHSSTAPEDQLIINIQPAR